MNAREMFEEQRYKRNEENEEIIYLQRFGSGYFRITFDLSKEEIAIDTNMENVIESDLLQAIIKQAKELGWLEEEKQEIKKETNYEHYKDKIIKDGIWNLALVNGKPKRCHNVYCNDCDFKTSRECKKKLEEWLKHPYKKLPYKLSQFEFDIIQTYRDCHESCKFSEFKQLIELKDKGYFKCVNYDTKVNDILANCAVVTDEKC